ncbi:guanine nucleotide binding protein, alpha subunit [Pterulicium gracile]|uniref:Guanine nucleotide binding protein, alpha subunit n=1 Tax=Pterulicium gracile TaxID=1884261 RepID=A0A5C3QL43_9AGAR|nr:guanine nucleotide binding protein, alpha subunit [Pterula gracilis]
MMSRHHQDVDPLDAVLRPPPDETNEQRALRIASEEHAKAVSEEIDAAIRAEQQRRKKRVVKLLLLGQSESGKSTTLRQFQRIYTPTAFREERVLWRAVIQLNIVRSIRTILDAIYLAIGSYSPPAPHLLTQSIAQAQKPLIARLQPIRELESFLIAKLVPPNEDEPTSLTGAELSSSSGDGQTSSWRSQEVFVRGVTGWRSVLDNARLNQQAHGSNVYSVESVDECQQVLYRCRADIAALWGDAKVRDVLKRKKVRLEEGPGFFLNDLRRVTSLKYSPSDDDVLKARLKTVGVSEYKFEMEVAAGRDAGTEWRIIDVGGSRSQVSRAWVPFFEDVDAIVFLAPISAFDQVLSEDRTVNRLEDSVLLWKAVCSNKLLANVELVLFLNKCDILDTKLKSGIRLAKYVRTYGERENDLESVTKYLKGKFSAIHREYSPNPRKFYVFATSVTDTTTTGGIIASVRDIVVRRHLSQSKLL